ncbi:iron-siderophore ABC transporter substrate-binding protein [Marinobacterium sp. D7]|uniref:ABC transporter substrate-binding protein n=1 Tax=Marinobacterium ramblicola TaxID=2849041 RepID=UPI001C2DDAEA|nr:iron-siderophore ABC transporter substrate-binding protein [Marinobacterium ramblicola]MBV1786813.1 iron-siderophore ABC transporter substrate-binding protein [Marinobacterium ramblicola]
MTKTRFDPARRRTLLQLGLGLLACGGPGIALADTEPRPLRVITLFQGATDCAVALGIVPCATVESWTEKPIYRYLRPSLQGVPQVGLETQPSLEDIALLEPDLIVASRFRHARIAPLLRQLAPLVMLDQVYEFKQTLALMGQALQRQRQAQTLLTGWQRRIDRLRDRLQRHFAGSRPLTVSVLDIRADHIRSYLPGSFSGRVLSELGFDWSAAARSADGVSIKITSRESLPVVNADIFFLFLRADSPSIHQHYAALTAHPLWQRMRAPQQGRVYRVDGVAWSLSGGLLGANLMLDQIERLVIEGPVIDGETA